MSQFNLSLSNWGLIIKHRSIHNFKNIKILNYIENTQVFQSLARQEENENSNTKFHFHKNEASKIVEKCLLKSLIFFN